MECGDETGEEVFTATGEEEGWNVAMKLGRRSLQPQVRRKEGIWNVAMKLGRRSLQSLE